MIIASIVALFGVGDRLRTTVHTLEIRVNNLLAWRSNITDTFIQKGERFTQHDGNKMEQRMDDIDYGLQNRINLMDLRLNDCLTSLSGSTGREHDEILRLQMKLETLESRVDSRFGRKKKISDAPLNQFGIESHGPVQKGSNRSHVIEK